MVISWGEIYFGEVFLENILVYWLSMARIPRSISDKIRRRIFSSLWFGHKDKEGVHLARQDKLGEVIKDKYFTQSDVVDWIRHGNKGFKGIVGTIC